MRLITDLYQFFTRRNKIADQLQDTPLMAEKRFDPMDTLNSDLEENICHLRETHALNIDIVFREIFIGGQEELRAVAIYFQGLINTDVLDRDVLHPLLFKCDAAKIDQDTPRALARVIYQNAIAVGQVETKSSLAETLYALHDGQVVLLIDRQAVALTIDIRGGETRGIEEPPAEKVLRGPRDGFVEQLQTNLSLVRRRLRDPNLIAEKITVGRRTRTDLALLYISDIADPKIIGEIKSRLGRINIDGVLNAGAVEQLIEDNPASIFPQIHNTERPDRVTAALLEGRAVIMVNGTPVVLIMPAILPEFFDTPDDYSERKIIGNFNRVLRYFAFFLTITLTPVYITLVSFHHELIPLKLLIPIAIDREEIPFSPVVNAFFMEFVVEILREAGIRLPTAVGQNMGIVGGIVLGTAAVQAHLISPTLLVIIAITAVSSFVFPNYSMSLAVRLLRFPMMVLAAALGGLGLAAGWILIIIHLARLESFSVPYLAPFAPLHFKDLKDTVFTTFIYNMRQRPSSIPNRNHIRQGNARRRDDQDER